MEEKSYLCVQNSLIFDLEKLTPDNARFPMERVNKDRIINNKY